MSQQKWDKISEFWVSLQKFRGLSCNFRSFFFKNVLEPFFKEKKTFQKNLSEFQGETPNIQVNNRNKIQKFVLMINHHVTNFVEVDF